MEQLMWIGIWIVGGVGLLVLIPVLVIGGWFIVVTLIMGLCDKAIGLLEQGWKTISRGSRGRGKPVLRVAEQNPILGKELASASGFARGSS